VKIFCSVLFCSCNKEEVRTENTTTELSNHKLESKTFIDCNCESYLVLGETIPTFESAETFKAAYECLLECNDYHLDAIDRLYPDISSDDYNDLIEQEVIKEWQVFDHFAKAGNYNSLLRKDLKAEDKWLAGGAEIEDAPVDLIVDDVLKALIDNNCEIKIAGELINICEDMQQEKDLEWCTPYGVRSDFAETDDGAYRIKLSGSIYTIYGTSAIAGKIVAYKKRNNGNWERNREWLSVGATCSVRRSPLNDCDLLSSPAVTGFKQKKTRSLRVSKINWFSTQIWFKEPFATADPMIGADGLVRGNSDHVAGLLGF